MERSTNLSPPVSIPGVSAWGVCASPARTAEQSCDQPWGVCRALFSQAALRRREKAARLLLDTQREEANEAKAAQRSSHT